MSTICAPATPCGGAIAIVRLSGPEAISIASSIFSRDLTALPAGTFHHGVIRESEGAEPVDDVIVSISRAPHSYTGEDTIEISHHGSRFIQKRIMEMLIQRGARLANPGEFTQRAFLAGKMDLSQAEAVADLIASTGAATHRIAMSQLRGGFTHELAEIRSQLLRLTSLLELELDFSEQDVEFADRTELLHLTETIEQHISRLLASFQTGNALKNGIPVAIIGAPNVGKSTLLNALLHDDKAIVSPIQGTTRDIIEDVMIIDGLTFRFIDTAGIRRTRNQVEKIGIERSMQAAQSAQIIILLSEPGVPFPDLRLNDEQKPILRVINKSDLFMPASSYLFHKEAAGNLIHISALTGAGIPLLTKALLREAAIPTFTENDTVVTSVRHAEALDAALSATRRIRQGITSHIPSDLIAQDLRLCLHHLGEITGSAITPEETLQNIFSHFCVGK